MMEKKTASFSEIEKCVTILLDEMKIQEDLVWDKHSGELIGLVDLSGIYKIIPLLKVLKN